MAYQEYVEFTLVATAKPLIVLKDGVIMIREESDLTCTIWVESYGAFNISDNIATVRAELGL